MLAAAPRRQVSDCSVTTVFADQRLSPSSEYGGRRSGPTAARNISKGEGARSPLLFLCRADGHALLSGALLFRPARRPPLAPRPCSFAPPPPRPFWGGWGRFWPRPPPRREPMFNVPLAVLACIG